MMKSWITLVFCICTATLWSQDLMLYIQTSPEGASVRNGDEVLGETPLLLSQKQLRGARKLQVLKAGYEPHEIDDFREACVALRLNRKGGYNRNPLKSPFYAIYRRDTVRIDPMVMDDASKSYNCLDTRIYYKKLGNRSPKLVDYLEGCELTYLSRFSYSDPLFAPYLNGADLSFPIQQELIDITPVANQFKSKRKRKENASRYENKQLWYILAKDGNKKLFFMPLDEEPDPNERRPVPDFSGNIPGGMIYAHLIYQDSARFDFVTQDNFAEVLQQLPSNQALQQLFFESKDLYDFILKLLAVENAFLGSIMQESFDAEYNPSPAQINTAKVYDLLEERKTTQRITIGAEPTTQADPVYQAEEEESGDKPWYLQGLKNPKGKTDTSEVLIYSPAQESTAPDSSANTNPWYLKGDKDLKPTEIDVSNTRFKNPYEKPKRQTNYTPWYLKDSNGKNRYQYPKAKKEAP